MALTRNFNRVRFVKQANAPANPPVNVFELYFGGDDLPQYKDGAGTIHLISESAGGDSSVTRKGAAINY